MATRKAGGAYRPVPTRKLSFARRADLARSLSARARKNGAYALAVAGDLAHEAPRAGSRPTTAADLAGRPLGRVVVLHRPARATARGRRSTSAPTSASSRSQPRSTATTCWRSTGRTCTLDFRHPRVEYLQADVLDRPLGDRYASTRS